MNQKVGVRIQGDSTRRNQLKRFALYSRKEYSGSKWFNYSFFEDQLLIHVAVLREGFINAFCQSLVKDRLIGTQESIPVTVFLDGEFWYNTYIQTKYNEKYFAEKYNLSENNIEIKKNGNVYANTDIKHYIERHNLGNEEEYEAFCNMINVQSYIDYSCTNLFLANQDTSEKKNILIWRTYVKENENFGNTKWNWALYDMDLLTYRARQLSKHETDKDYAVNTFTEGIDWVEGVSYNQGKLYTALKENKSYCRLFVITFMDLVNENFSYESVSKMMDQWGEYTIENYNDGFFLHRAEYIVPYMAEEFDLKGTQETVKLSSNYAGYPITLNTIQPEIIGSWSGKYFTDYPVTVTANEVSPDHPFDHWVVTSKGERKEYIDTTIEVPVEGGGVEINAIFK